METSNPYKGLQNIKEFAAAEPLATNPVKQNSLVYATSPSTEYTMNSYQVAACKTKSYPEKNAITYPALGLSEETGEVCGKIKKWLRGDVPELNKEAMKKEMGDVLWYLASLADDLGFTLDDVARTNIEKLKQRVATNTIKGNGDDREQIAKIKEEVAQTYINTQGKEEKVGPYYPN